jgi:hypothetical protein
MARRPRVEEAGPVEKVHRGTEIIRSTADTPEMHLLRRLRSCHLDVLGNHVLVVGQLVVVRAHRRPNGCRIARNTAECFQFGGVRVKRCGHSRGQMIVIDFVRCSPRELWASRCVSIRAVGVGTVGIRAGRRTVIRGNSQVVVF